MAGIKKYTALDMALKKQKRPKDLEYPIHKAIAEYLNLVIKRPSRWHTVEVSNQASGKSAMIRQMMLKRKGVVTSWPDICIYHWHDIDNLNYTRLEVIFFEVKIPGVDATEKQKNLHAELRHDGFPVDVVHSVEEVATILRDYGVI